VWTSALLLVDSPIVNQFSVLNREFTLVAPADFMHIMVGSYVISYVGKRLGRSQWPLSEP
jgi:hypothetical protein